jgi:hypothetical protein
VRFFYKIEIILEKKEEKSIICIKTTQTDVYNKHALSFLFFSQGEKCAV